MRLSFWRGWLRFRLRTLLVALTVAAAWVAWYAHTARVQQASVEAIRKYGGWVRYDFQFPSGRYEHTDFDGNAGSPVPEWLLEQFGVDLFHSVVQVNLNYSEDSGSRQENGNSSDEALQHLRGLPNLRVLLLADSQASDEALAHLAHLGKLECLMMWDVANVTDRGAAHLEGLTNLRYIHLSSSQITDRSLALFAALPKIEGLSLQFNHFTDEGLRHASRADHLESLWVCGTGDSPNPITDDGLKLLHRLTNLKDLGVQSTEVTAQAVAEFKRAVPGCQVHD